MIWKEVTAEEYARLVRQHREDLNLGASHTYVDERLYMSEWEIGGLPVLRWEEADRQGKYMVNPEWDGQ